MRLLGGRYFLVLHRAQESSEHSIALLQQFDKVLASWDAGTRVSPVFAVENSAPPPLGSLARCWLHFLGPFAPGELTTLPTPHGFLTLGLFNLLVISTSDEERRAAACLAASLPTSSEEWELASGKIEQVHFTTAKGTKGRRRVKRITGGNKTSQESLREYTSVLSTSMARATLFAPQFVPDLEKFDNYLRSYILKDAESTVGDHQRWIVLTNAALSRQSSQTFAGTSPIVETECHLWSHSLLGAGIASLALLRVRQFLESMLSRGRLVDRLLQLEFEAAYPEELEQLVASDPFWDRDHLFEYGSQKTIPGVDAPGPEGMLPLITCFSGRDGFRSTLVSLSAPLEVISCCNTQEWSLLTLTHESSHNMIYSFLGQLLPKHLNLSGLKKICDWLKDGIYPNLLEQLRAFTCFGFWRLNNVMRQEIEAPELKSTILKHWPYVNEVLTHCFDFLYFYRRDPEQYISAVWASWGVVPNIQSRVSSYVVRCLCALHTRNLARKNSLTVTIDTLEVELSKAQRMFPTAPYIPDALADLQARRKFYEDEIKRHLPLIKLARYFFYSPSIEALIFEDPNLTGGGRGGYPFVSLDFGPERIENPLRFIAAYARDAGSDARRSLWMLYQIAFGKESW